MKNKKGQYTSKAKKRLERKIAFAQAKQVWRIAVAVILLGVFPVMEIKDRLNKEYVFENTEVLVNTVERVEETETSSAKPLDANGTMVVEKEAVAASPTASISVIQKVAEKEGIDWKILAALFIKETQGNCNREGDKDFIKPSWGCYQINKHYHPEVTWEQATDIEWSSYWTANRLKAKASKYGWDNAIAMHNGNPKNPAVQAYLADVKEIIKSL